MRNNPTITAGDLRKALEGVPDDVPVTIQAPGCSLKNIPGFSDDPDALHVKNAFFLKKDQLIGPTLIIETGDGFWF